MNPLILFLSLEYFSRILASPSAFPEIFELVDESSNTQNPSSSLLNSGSGLSGSIEPLTPSGQTHKRKAELIHFCDEETQKNLESKEDGQYFTSSVSVKKRSPLPEVEKMDVRSLASMIPLLNLNVIREHLDALGEEAKSPIKDNCGWNLLHEAVFTDNFEFAKILMLEYGFSPSVFDPYFGTTAYLVKSKRMAELLRNNGANLNDQRPCYLYDSAVHSARSRREMALVSIVESFTTRSTQLHSALSEAQTTLAATRFACERAKMFDTALSKISTRQKTSCASLEVVFFGEEGRDAGGLSVEFINLIKEVIISRERVLLCDGETGFYQLRPDPVVITKEDASRESQDVKEIKLLGYIVGLSIYHNVPLNIEFNPIMYYIMCGLNPNRDIDMMEVLRETDPTCYNSFRRMGEISESEIVEYAFPVFKGDEIRSWKSERGIMKSKNEIIRYCPLAAKNRVYTPYANALAHFRAGIDSAVAANLIYDFITPEELKAVLTGERDYTAADWRAACAPPTHNRELFDEQYEWFWRAVDDISAEERAVLLQYVTSLISLPIGGFKALSCKPVVEFINDQSKMDNLPNASTCFNTIRLYPTSSYEMMKKNLILAAKFGINGFGDH